MLVLCGPRGPTNKPPHLGGDLGLQASSASLKSFESSRFLSFGGGSLRELWFGGSAGITLTTLDHVASIRPSRNIEGEELCTS